MTHPDAITLRLSYPTGDTHSIVEARVSDWQGRAVGFPRAEFGEVKRHFPVYERRGVYMLTHGTTLYVGETENLAHRIDTHRRAAKMDWWSRGVVFCDMGEDIGGDEVKYIESVLIQRANDTGLWTLENKAGANKPGLKLQDIDFANARLRGIYLISRALGIGAFEGEGNIPAPSVKTHQRHGALHKGGGGAQALGRCSNMGRQVALRRSINERGG